MPLTKTVITQPNYLQDKTYAARDDRRGFADFMSAGVIGASDMLVSSGGGLVSSIAAGGAWVLGGSVTDQGEYRVFESTAKQLTHAAHESQPRIDQIILRIMDADHDATGLREANYAIAKGVAAASPVPLDLTTPANIDNSRAYIVLASVAVPATSGAFTYTDVRARAKLGGGTMLGGGPSYGTTLPASPSDGQEAILVDSLSAATYFWRFRYSPAQGAYPWLCIGGTPKILIDDANVSLNTQTQVGSSGFWYRPSSMSFTIPRAGAYLIDGRVNINSASDGNVNTIYGFYGANLGGGYSQDYPSAGLDAIPCKAYLGGLIVGTVIGLAASSPVGKIIRHTHIEFTPFAVA